MSYNNSFYKAYENYLLEPSVRQAHDWIFSIIEDNLEFQNVVDLGCGKSQEFYNYFKPLYYLGVDENAEECEPSFKYATLKKNYRTITKWSKETSFVSLFSSEITAPFTDNYRYYNALFSKNKFMHGGLVSGFYYESKKDQNPIGETGGIQSYQTLESIEDCKHYGFKEKRILLSVPSRMFGPDVVEVWKIFWRV
jgi:hypothetical protein